MVEEVEGDEGERERKGEWEKGGKRRKTQDTGCRTQDAGQGERQNKPKAVGSRKPCRPAAIA